VSDVQGQIRDAELQLIGMRLEAQLRENLALFEQVAPELHARFNAYEPRQLRLHYSDEGYVELVDCAAGNRPVYPGNPFEHTSEQLARYLRQPTSFQCHNQRATILDEERNAHVLNSNGIADLLTAHPQERPAALPDFVNFMLVLGVGLGYHLEGLLEASDIRNLCVIEPQAELFHASLHTVDWSSVIEHFSRPGCTLELIVGEDRERCCAQLSEYLTDIGGFNAVHPFVYEHLASPELALSFSDFANRVMPTQISALGYFDDEQVGFAHSVRNYQNGTPVLQDDASPHGQYVDKPAFVVANGPSLDRAVDFLREHRDRAVIFSCGSALGSLTKAGIKPDFHVEMERSRPVIEWIESSTTAADREGVVLLTLNTVHPDVLELFERRGMAMKANDVGTQYLSRYFAPASRVIDFGDCNPTVANAALAYASAFGFSEVYLFGLDLGFSAGDQHHSVLSKHYDVKRSEEHTLGLYSHDGEHNSTAPGNFGGEIVTTPVYLAARATMERVVSANPRMRCFNTSEGLRIDGAEPILIDDIGLPSEPFDAAETAREIFERCFRLEGLGPLQIEDVRQVADGSLAGLEDLRRIAAQPAGTRSGGMDVLAGLRRAVETMFAAAELRTSATLLSGSVSLFCVLLAQALHRFEDEDRSVALYRECLERFSAFLEAAEIIVRTSLLDTDTRTRELEKKLVASV